jgi:two-component system sensor histidine kinase HydH
MAEHIFDEMKRYVRFGLIEELALRDMGPLLEPAFGPIVDEFYARIAEHPGAVAVISGGAAQVERLKQTLGQWLVALFAGPWDHSYFEQRARIGRRHVLIQLPLHYNFAAMDLIRNRLIACALELSDREQAARRATAINKLVDIELAIILHTYHEDFMAQLGRRERLATFGHMTSAIGHELRNPLGVIASSAFLLGRRFGDDPASMRHIDKIQAQVARSSRIITSLLDIVRDRPPLRTKVAPRKLAEIAVGALHDARGSVVEVAIAEEVHDVLVDPEQIGQVLVNLLTNAIEAAGPQGSVRLAVVQRPGEVEFRVSDSGVGVDPSVRARMFEPLVTTKSTGVGLGLALCRKLVDAHHGVLELLPSGELSGATFSLRLRA